MNPEIFVYIDDGNNYVPRRISHYDSCLVPCELYYKYMLGIIEYNEFIKRYGECRFPDGSWMIDYHYDREQKVVIYEKNDRRSRVSARKGPGKDLDSSE